MVGEFITFLHRNIRIVTTAVLILGAVVVIGLARLLLPR